MKLKISQTYHVEDGIYDLDPDIEDAKQPEWIIDFEEVNWRDYQATRAKWLDWQNSLRHYYSKAARAIDDRIDRDRDLKKLAELKAKYEGKP